MPELPEVETVCAGLRQSLPGQRIKEVQLHRKDLRTLIPEDFTTRCEKQKITGITRRAKYFQIHLENQDVILGHLGMSGKMLVFPHRRNHTEKHDHVCFFTENGQEIVFHDPRRFGLLTIAKEQELSSHPLLVHLGVEPLSDAFHHAYLFHKLRNKKVAIKQAIMDAAIVVGVGNIYASEALFLCGVDPRRAANSLSESECGHLVNAIRKVLKDAIQSGGSTLKDYVGSSGEAGYFQHQFNVYGREQAPCFNCTLPIKRIQQAKRSSFFCEQCQK